MALYLWSNCDIGTKLEFTFKMFDMDKNGKLDLNEIKHIITVGKREANEIRHLITVSKGGR